MRLMFYVQGSPRSEFFNKNYESAMLILNGQTDSMAFSSPIKWTAWTIYKHLLRWRHGGFDMASLGKKGVQYCPWEERKDSYYTMIEKIVHEVVMHNPNDSSNSLKKKVRERLQEIQRLNENDREKMDRIG